MLNSRLVKAVDRFLVRRGMVIVKTPYDDWSDIADANKHAAMAFHWCYRCKECRFSHLFDPLSQSSRVVCSKCGAEYPTAGFAGISLFQLYACCSLGASMTGKRFLQPLYVGRFLIFGLGKHLPIDRGGKTIAELEVEAVFILLHPFMAQFSMKG